MKISCEDIYNNNPETGNKNGYYPINNTKWTFCNMTAVGGVVVLLLVVVVVVDHF